MIEVIEKIDAIEEYEDGGVDLIIYCHERIDNAIGTQVRLMDKVEFYLDVKKTDEFKQQYSGSNIMNVTIILQLKYEPTELIKELSCRIAEWTDYYNAKFVWSVK